MPISMGWGVPQAWPRQPSVDQLDPDRVEARWSTQFSRQCGRLLSRQRWGARPWVRAALRRAAIRYAAHGWPVIPGAYLVHDRFLCGPLCPTVGCHPAVPDWPRQATVDRATVTGWWSAGAYSVLLATGTAFEVIDTPARFGASAAAVLGGTGPVAVTPTGRWLYLVAPGTPLRAELAARFDVVLHGPDSWIPVPPTVSPTGPIRWHIAPHRIGWRLADAGQVQRVLLAELRGSTRTPANTGRTTAVPALTAAA
jgi:bifunctional DNA primase/polymerase-like protein